MSDTAPTAGPSRRTVLTAAGWTAPSVALAAAAPAYAASGVAYALAFEHASYRLPSNLTESLHCVFHVSTQSAIPPGRLMGVAAGPESDYPAVTSRFVTATTAAGAPVPGVPVTFTITDPGATNLRFHPQDASSSADPRLVQRIVVTDAAGVAVMPRLFQLNHSVLPMNTYDATVSASVDSPVVGRSTSSTFTPEVVTTQLRRGNTAPAVPVVVTADGTLTRVSPDAGMSTGIPGGYHSLAAGRLVVDDVDLLMPDGEQVIAPGTTLLVRTPGGIMAASAYHFRPHHDRFADRHGVTFFPEPLPAWWSTHPTTTDQPAQFVTVWPATGEVKLSGVTDRTVTSAHGPELLMSYAENNAIVKRWIPHKLWYRGELVADWSKTLTPDFGAVSTATPPPVQFGDVRPSWLTTTGSSWNGTTNTTTTLHHWVAPDDVRTHTFGSNVPVSLLPDNVIRVNGVHHLVDASSTPGELVLTPLAIPEEATQVVVRRRASGGVLAWYATATSGGGVHRWTIEGGSVQVSGHALATLHEGGVHVGASPSGPNGTAVAGRLLGETSIDDLCVRLDAEAEFVEMRGRL